MRFLALAVFFTLNLFGLGECVSCHEEQAKFMTSECTSCHTQTLEHRQDKLQKTSPVTLQDFKKFSDDDKPVWLSYQGLLQKNYGSKEYFHMQSDIHFQKGMICQDCHTSNEIHNDGFWSSKRGSEIQCSDCHGTTKAYPWELATDDNESARGVYKQNNTTHLISSVGIPLVNILKKEQRVVVKLVSGEKLQLQPLKLLKNNKQLSKNGLVAMENIQGHTENLTCSSCHTAWTPQFFGSVETTDLRVKKVTNQVTKTSMLMRWEEPFLAKDQNGKIVPAAPKTPLKNIEIDKAGRVVEYWERNRLTPFAPHTIQKDSRSCESCHTSSKVLNGSIDSGSFQENNITRFNLSKVFTAAQQDKLDRRGVCLSCHEIIPNGTLAVSTIAHISQMMLLDIDEKEHQMILNRILNMSAWFQIILVLFIILILAYMLYTILIRKKSINPRNKGWK